MPITRRRLIALLPPAFGALIVAACGGDDAPESATSSGGAQTSSAETPSAASTGAAPAASTPAGAAQVLAATPSCGDDDDDPTSAQTEGPYFKARSPERTSLIESGVTGTKLALEGLVLNTGCQPVARALVDFWQADGQGNYDNSGFRLRGHQFTDDQGRFELETVVPGLYPGRTRHIHVKVQAPNRPVLTTQLYFPGETGNARDGIYNRELEFAEYKDAAGGKAGRFNFVLNA
jgi:protocatechuate 3,4-dioxygenase beta subunit